MAANKFSPIDATDLLLEEETPPNWQAGGLWERGDIVVLGFPPSNGKSTLATSAALSVATGKPVWGKFPLETAGRVAYFQGEMGKGKTKRLINRLVRGDDIAAQDLKGRIDLFIRQTAPLNDHQGLADIAGGLKISAAKGQIDLIVFDTLRRFKVGSQNDEEVIGGIIEGCRYLQKTFGDPTIILLHHTSKPGPNPPDDIADLLGGSKEILAQADVVLMNLKRSQDEDVEVMQIIQSKGRESEIPPFEIRFSGRPRGTDQGWRYPLNIKFQTKKEKAAEWEKKQAEVEYELNPKIIAYLESNESFSAGRSEVIHRFSEDFSENTVDTALKAMERAGELQSHKDHGKRVYAINRKSTPNEIF